MSWQTCPENLLQDILYYLDILDVYNASRTCKHWWAQYSNSVVWRNVTFNFNRGMNRDKALLSLIGTFGHHIRRVNITLDQGDIENRALAYEAIEKLANISRRQVECLTITCTGENPLFYAGMEFIQALEYFANTIPPDVKRMLKYLDLSALPFQIKGDCILSFKNHFDSLQYLDIQNKQLICLVHPDALRTVVVNCPQLCDLRVFYCSLDEDILISFTDSTRRKKLKHLSALCRRELKFMKDDLRSCVWTALTCFNPNLQVTLRFDHTCPLGIVRQVMKPEVPVTNLFLETYTKVYPELEMVYENYAESLRKVVLQTQMSEELDYSLLQLVNRCHKLISVHVLCPVTPSTILEILRVLPALKQFDDYTLRPDYTPEPWVTAAILDEIKLNQGLG